MKSNRSGVESEIRRRGLSTFRLPGVTSLWSVRLTDGARVKELSRRDELRRLLRKLETHGERSAHYGGDYRDPIVVQLRAIGWAFFGAPAGGHLRRIPGLFCVHRARICIW
ncbi:MAG TPA: hypothetical protein VIV12_31695 [Streptosporangiaceae bacterium]